MRISEFTGLTLKNLDMENRTINIDHQLQKTGTLVYIDTTKTYAGTRVIPMQADVYECVQNIIKARPKLKVEPMIDGYSGFLCFDKDGKPMVAMCWEKYFQHAVQKYNRIYRIQLPKITPHGRVIIRTSQKTPVNTRGCTNLVLIFNSLKKGKIRQRCHSRI